MRVIFKGVAQLCDHPGQDPGRHVAVAPDRIHQHVTTDQLAGVPEQQKQDGERLGLDRQRLVVATEGVRTLIDDHAVKTVPLACRSPLAVTAAGIHRNYLRHPSSTCAKADATLAPPS
ncbi:MAG: hypothetical protein M3Q42_03705 [Pseudomonadota bacterium]|nr:hypothetical protein [Pseudomonadota bacterium]